MAFAVFIVVGAFMLLLSILFKLASIFRLTIPLAYALIAPTLFHTWFQANPVLANGIGYALFGLVGLSWIVSLVRKIRAMIAHRRENEISEQIYLKRYREAVKNGDDIKEIPIDDLWRR